MNRSLGHADLFGLFGVVLSAVCWFNVLYKWSLFDLLPSVAARRHTIVVIAVLAVTFILIAVVRGSRWWLLGLVPSVAMVGLLRLH
jgi:hypothetical protein